MGVAPSHSRNSPSAILQSCAEVSERAMACFDAWKIHDSLTAEHDSSFLGRSRRLADGVHVESVDAINASKFAH